MSNLTDPIKYKVLKYDPGIFSGKAFNGKNSGKRRCRFCGQVLDETHFQKEAHAISVSLGNKKFFCADECDECNEKFGQSLENDVTQFFQVFLSLYQVPKRDGQERQVSGRNFDMKMSNENPLSTDLPLLRFHLNDWKDDNAIPDEVIKKMTGLDLSNKTFVPQNIYKAICKYALSLMPHSMTLHYQRTIQWIRDNSFESSLPKLKIASFDRKGNEPVMFLLLLETPSELYPLCVANLCVANIHLFYILPFCDESGGVEKDNILFDNFWNQFTKGAPISYGQEYEDADLSSSKRIGFKIEMDLKMEPGATAMFLKKDETGQWAPEEKKF